MPTCNCISCETWTWHEVGGTIEGTDIFNNGGTPCLTAPMKNPALSTVGRHLINNPEIGSMQEAFVPSKCRVGEA